MYKGEPSKGLEFYNLLFDNNEFTAELGKVVLAAGRLEVEMILFLNHRVITENITKLTLSGLISICEKNNLLDKNFIISLRMICNQRNYFTHNIYALLIEQIDVTILERNNLLDTDVITYTNYVLQLVENLEALGEIIHKKNQEIK